jgi:antimicrobial peptide system SdpB family protein
MSIVDFSFTEIKEKIKINHNFWTKELGIVRTLIAVSTFLTLIFNSSETLFLTGLENELFLLQDKVDYINIYTWFNSFLYGKIFSIIVLFFVILGLNPRVTCVFHWLVTYSFTITSTCTDGGDQVASIITLLLIPICILDTRSSHWKSQKNKFNYYKNNFAFVFTFLILLQIFAIYFFASTGKFQSEVWQNGTALYYYSTLPQMGLSKGVIFDFFNFIIKSPIILTLSTWGILILELFIAIGIFIENKILRKYIYFLGLLLHIFIILFYGILSFSLTMIACLFFAYKYNPIRKYEEKFS